MYSDPGMDVYSNIQSCVQMRLPWLCLWSLTDHQDRRDSKAVTVTRLFGCGRNEGVHLSDTL